MTDWVTLELPSAAHVVGIARAMAVASASSANVPVDRIEDVRTCASEAVTNAVQAHRRVEIHLPILIRTTVSAGRFVMEVCDVGPGLDEEMRSRGVDGPPREGGYGIPVMRALSDSFDVTPGGVLQPGMGTTVRMTYLLEPAV